MSNKIYKDYKDIKEEKILAKLGYKQEFQRRWSGFSNFAISLSVISILSGTFTAFGQAWNSGGPFAMSVGWFVAVSLILFIALSMSELVSAMPTSGGIYYWSAKLGKPIHGWLTGWLNLIGLVAASASVAYGFSSFSLTLLNRYFPSINPSNLQTVFGVFILTIVIQYLITVYWSKIIHLVENVSAYWHLFGASFIILILALIPKNHQSVEWVFTTQFNNTGFNNYWFYVLPIGTLIAFYTVTGFDASAHVSEETKGASTNAAKGLWKAVLYSGILGWVLLLSFLFAATDVDAINESGGYLPSVFFTSLPEFWALVILFISSVGQFFCGLAIMIAGSRMLFAFSRGKAVPGYKFWSKMDKNSSPSNAALGVGLFAIILALPALYAPEGTDLPIAFYAVASICVIGFFGSFGIPIYLRWKAGDNFVQGEWNLGKHWKWIAPLSVLEIVLIMVYFMLPTSPAGVPFSEEFSWLAVQYAPIATLIVVGGALIWWKLSAKNWFHKL